MTVTIGSGYANINGKVAMSDESTTLDIAAASGTLNRIDAVVLRRNDTDRLCSLLVVQGTNATSPTVPELVRSNGIYDIRLAEIYVAAGAVKILTDNITDKRADSSVCGWVTGTVETIDSAQMLAQLTAQFDTWFAAMKDQLTTDAAGHLQTEIDAKKLKIKTLTVPHASVVANTDIYATATPPYPYCYDFALVEITDNTAAKVKPQTDADYASFIKYANGANYTSAGSIRIYFKKQPTEDLNVKIEYAEGTVIA